MRYLTTPILALLCSMAALPVHAESRVAACDTKQEALSVITAYKTGKGQQVLDTLRHTMNPQGEALCVVMDAPVAAEPIAYYELYVSRDHSVVLTLSVAHTQHGDVFYVISSAPINGQGA